ncbi:hypothetical protein Goklo_007882 [Gossypium klotzschianum]|uniref:Uncharacterized protein n=1 Tax=Gossypium klotzschianum TaxID=34286 RepID=A0A7J8UYL8_9ROSI|nr:hypothetical protein [Gossypium klotzschianum]
MKEDYKVCLVGSYLTASVMYFPSMRNTVDMNMVLEGSPWFVNNHLLLLYKDFIGVNGETVWDFLTGLSRLRHKNGPHKYEKYEKLSMFCFIYGKLGHGGEFLPAAGNGGAICNTPYPFPSPE